MTTPDRHPPAPASPSSRDGWHELCRYTSARIALGRAGGSCRTETLLELRAAHARARDAVLKPFQVEALEVNFQRAGLQTFRLTTLADSRHCFLVRPDLARALSENSRRSLMESRPSWGRRDLALIVSDGLSAQAAERQAAPTLEAGWTVYPIFVVPFGRVKLQDEIGELLSARQILILLGERPVL